MDSVIVSCFILSYETTYRQCLQDIQCSSSSMVPSQQVLNCLQSQILWGSEFLFVLSMSSQGLLSTNAKSQIWLCAGLFKPTSRPSVFTTKKKSKLQRQVSAGNLASSQALGGVILPDCIQSGKERTREAWTWGPQLPLEKQNIY